MSFFDVSSSLKIPDVSAKVFERKLVGTFRRYNIAYEKVNDEKIIFRTFMLQFGTLANRRFIFHGVSTGEIKFSNRGKDLIVQFKLAIASTRILLMLFALSMLVISIIDVEFGPLIMTGVAIILYFVVKDGVRYRFKKWFSRFTN